MPQTKRLPVGFDPNKPNRRIGHVVPKWTLGLAGDGFLAVDSPKEALIGRMVYLGREVASADILKKITEFHQLAIPRSEAMQRLDRFLALLEKFKIGHLVRCVIDEGLRLESVPEISAFSKPLPLP